MEAQQWLDNLTNRKETADILRTNYFNLPADILADPFQGKYDMGDGRVIDDKSMAAYYWKDEKVAFILQEPRFVVPDRKRSLAA